MPAVAAAATLLVGLGTGWFARDADLERAGTPTTFTRQAALTHALYASDANRPVEVWAPEEKRLVTWLSKRLGFPVNAPNLNSTGFALVGGRLVAGQRTPPRCSCTRMPTSNGFRCRSASSRWTPAKSRSGMRSRTASASSTGSRTTAATRCPAIDRGQLLAVGRVVYGQLAALEAAPVK